MKKAYSVEERFEALKLASEIGNQAAADRLGIKVDTLYTWIKRKARVFRRTWKYPNNRYNAFKTTRKGIQGSQRRN